MAAKILQINANHARAAQYLALQKAIEDNIGLVLISEPYRVPSQDDPPWFVDTNKLAAIYINTRCCSESAQLLDQGPGYVAVRIGRYKFYSCYISPNKPIDEFELYLQNLSTSLERNGRTQSIIAGDLNAKNALWGSRTEDIRGRILAEWTAQHDLVVLNVGAVPTFSRCSGESCIDITFCTGDLCNNVTEWKVHDEIETLSDHRYIITKLTRVDWVRLGVQRQRYNYPRWNSKKINEDFFAAAIIAGNWKIEKCYESPEEAAKDITRTLKNAANIAMSRIKTNNNGRKNAFWWTTEISEARKTCCQLRRKLKKKRPSADTQTIMELKRNLKDARMRLKNLILESKKKSWVELMNSVDHDPWGKPYKIVMQKLRRAVAPVSETLERNFLSGVLSYLFPEKESRYPIVTNDNEFNDGITEEEFKYAINKMKSGISPGPDGFTAEMIARVVASSRQSLKNIFNQCVKKGHFPNIWKEGRLVLIKKPMKPEHMPSSYRPICVISELAKILERIIVYRINKHLAESGFDLCKDQYGFRRNCSTVDAILEFKARVKDALSKGWTVIAVSLDISNAFNTISWDVINEEMERKNFPLNIRAIINSYLRNRYITFINKEGSKERKEISCGVPQGSVLGPVLWNIAYDRVLGQAVYRDSSLICYADDTLHIAKAETEDWAIESAEIGTNVLINRIERMGLKVAVDKTEVIMFRPSKNKTAIEINIAGKKIKTKPYIKYLGVIIDEDWNMKEHANYVAERGLKTINRLSGLMPNVKGPKESRRRLYSAVAHSILLYAAPVWADEIKTKKARKELGKLQKIQKMISLRIISGYRTISYVVALMLARILPIEYQADILRKLYIKKKDLLNSRDEDLTELSRHHKILVEDSINRWKITLSKPTLPGKWTRTALLPQLTRWFHRTNSTSMSYRLTQLITGHGCFSKFLYRIKKLTTTECGFCGEMEDSAQHTIEECIAWSEERRKLKNQLGEDLDLRTIFSRMLESNENWTAFQSFAERVMTRKENKEREDEERGNRRRVRN